MTRTHQLSTYVDLDMGGDAAAHAAACGNVDALLADVEEWITLIEGEYHIDLKDVQVSVVTLHGSGGGCPVVRFTAQPDDIDRILAAYEAEAEGATFHPLFVDPPTSG